MIYILGLDMSRAFDTIDRAQLMSILRNEVRLEEDDLRMCQSLLADTNLKVKLGQALSDPFTTTIGTPQGDGLSPILFAIYLENALREVRTQASNWPRSIDDAGLPLEAIYADDCDFISTSLSHLQKLEEIIPPTIGRYKLMANASKWERTLLEPSTDEWRKTKKLGSLLGDEQDVGRRKVLATVAFKSLSALWKRRKITRISTRMQAYNTLVLPVLLYNCGTWGVTEGVMEKIETYHRRQLREILGVKTRDLRNEELYKRCGTSPLQKQITRSRWSLFGHTLRLSRDTPAQLAMDYYCKLREGEAEPLGRPDTTLPVLLFSEYKKYKGIKKMRGWTVQKSKEKTLAELRELASDKPGWRELVTDICDVLVSS